METSSDKYLGTSMNIADEFRMLHRLLYTAYDQDVCLPVKTLLEVRVGSLGLKTLELVWIGITVYKVFGKGVSLATSQVKRIKYESMLPIL